MENTKSLSKQELVKALKSAKTSNVELAQRIQYALAMFAKDMTKVTKQDLSELLAEYAGLSVAAPVEASLKPKKAPAKKAVAKKAEEVEVIEVNLEDEVAHIEPQAKPKAKKKAVAKAKAEPKSPVDTLAPLSSRSSDILPTAKVFPEQIEHPELGVLVSCAGRITTYAELLEALEAEKTIYFACYWTKRHIKEYSYAQTRMVRPETVKNGFLFDLDILMAVLPCETMERVYAMSRITEALFQFEGEDLMPFEDTDPRTGEKFQIRASAGLEFEIYCPIDEA